MDVGFPTPPTPLPDHLGSFYDAGRLGVFNRRSALAQNPVAEKRVGFGKTLFESVRFLSGPYLAARRRTGPVQPELERFLVFPTTPFTASRIHLVNMDTGTVTELCEGFYTLPMR